ncbi:unnamed protein product [Adineta ricciae]|uniref:F-box domain-containing protein n=2 Tax=Adineta ricciae TaxID=249248 RepID=A0A815QBQ9_ADIRI|nr:unnamed protein product [Adineta ricciae]
MVNLYNRYAVNFTALSQQHFRLLCRLMNPQQVISLTLTNEYDGLNEIDLFLSNVRHLQSFNRLQNLVLENINENQLNSLLKYVNLTFITSFSMSIRHPGRRIAQDTEKLLKSIVTQPGLRQLDLSLLNLNVLRTDNATVSMVRYLVVRHWNKINDLYQIFQSCPHLHTVVLQEDLGRLDFNGVRESKPRSAFHQIRSLTLAEFMEDIEILELVLAMVPSLNHLTIIGPYSNLNLDGHRWQHLLEINLPQLKKFQFFLRPIYVNKRTLDELETFNATFQTPFWIEQKQWFVIAEYRTKSLSNIHIYTVPLCTREFICDLESTQLPSLATTMRIEHNNVKRITVELGESIDVSAERQEIFNNYCFGKITDLTLVFQSSWSGSLLPLTLMAIDITNVVCMSLAYHCKKSVSEDALKLVCSWLEQAQNLRRLEIYGEFLEFVTSSQLESILSILQHRLQCLEIRIKHLDQMKIFLERCDNLSRLKFHFDKNISKEIKQWFNDNTIGSICWGEYHSVFVWLGKLNTQCTLPEINQKRMKVDSFS